MCFSNKFFILIFLIASTTMACSQITYDEKLRSLYNNTVPTIQSDELEGLMVENKNLVILDIRSTEEYKVSHIPGAVFVDYDNFTAPALDGISKNDEVIVYCSVGYRSERIGEKMKEMGYINVRNLYGGIFQWKNEGRDVVNLHQSVTDSVHTYNKKWSRWLEKGIKVY